MAAGNEEGEPLSLLEQLDPFLGTTGCIKNGKDVVKMVSIMKGCQLLVSRCLVLNVIRTTKAQGTLAKFIEAGGWAVLNLWLAQAKKSQNTALLVELLQVLHKLPVTIAALKLGNMGKLVKQLSKQEQHAEVKALAGELLAKWMTVFREGQAAKSSGKAIGGAGEERSNSTSEESKSDTKSERRGEGKPPSKKKPRPLPPVEQKPPPGPLVALGKPKDKPGSKRPRELLLLKTQQLPPEKKSKASPSAGEEKAKGGGGGTGKALVESEGFMNALSSLAARSKEVKKVKKAKPSKPTARSNSSSTAEPAETTPTSSVEPPADPEPDSTEAPSGSSLKKKRVSWADDNNLVRFHFFDMNEAERVNVNRSKSFLDAAQQEKQREREALEQGLMFSRDRLIEMIPWQRPARVELSAVTEGFVHGGESAERKLQLQREETVLAQLFLSKSSLPSSASEPDPEPDVIATEPKLIPLMEPSVPGEVFAPPQQQQLPPPGQLPPDSPLPHPSTPQQGPLSYFHEGGGVPLLPPPPAAQAGGGVFYPPPPQQQGGGFAGPWSQQQPAPATGGGSNGGGAYYTGGGGGEQFPYFRGGGHAPLRGGRGPFPFRGRGGRGTGPWPKRGMESRMSRICKHFITHGCKLGSNCRFMHCTPEQLVTQMVSSDLPPPPSSSSSPSPSLLAGGPLPPTGSEELTQQQTPNQDNMDTSEPQQAQPTAAQ